MHTEFKEPILLRLLDAPLIYVRWTKDEWVVTCVPFLLLFVAQRYLEAFIAATLSYLCIKKMKKRFGDGKGTFNRVGYWYLGSGKKGLPDSNITEYLT